MRRVLAVAALAAAAIGGMGAAQPAYADVCVGTLICGVAGCTGTVNVCPTARSCSGFINVCPTAPPANCTGSIDVCLGIAADLYLCHELICITP